MTKINEIFVVFILLVARVMAAGELQVKLNMEQPSVLQFESVIAFVSIYNDSDAPFIIDQDDKDNNSQIRFIIEKRRDKLVGRINDGPLVGKLEILPGEKRDIMLDISLWYDLGSMGRYIACVAIDEGDRTFESNGVVIEVVRGVEIVSTSRSVSEDLNLVRTYSLRYWRRNEREYLFLSVDEEVSGLNYGVFPLGRLVRVFKPVINVDRSGNVKVLHQSGNDCYTCSLFKSTRDEVRFIDQRYYTADGAPYVFVDKETVGKLR